MKKIYIFIVLLSITLFAQAQADVEMPRIIPPSPNATSLGMYGDVPVGHYTGIPSINIPLYEIVSGDIRLPVSLSYHASGIKVAQEASWVGLGWALNAGGVITRSIRGWDDFSTSRPYGYVHSEDLPAADDNNCLDVSGVSSTAYLNDIYHNIIDAEPDIFYYNFGNYSGKMVLPKQNIGNEIQALILNQDPIDIKYNIKDKRWIVHTPDGCIYTFTTPEGSLIYSESVQSFIQLTLPLSMPRSLIQPTVINSWYLDDIRSPQGDVIQFYYTTKSRKIKSQFFISRNFVWLDDIQDFDIPATWSFYGHTTSLLSSFAIYTISQFDTDEIILNEIIFPNGRVKFESIDRLDLLYDITYNTDKPQHLNKMYVVNTTGQTITSYQFMTSYRGGNDPNKMRLFLDSIVDMSGKTYRFYYNQTPLPAKTSVAIDHWGYFNGKISNEDINSYTAIPSYTSETRYFPGADREATDDAQAGTLIKIMYPTGGYSEFDYSLNDYNNLEDIKYKDTTINYYAGDFPLPAQNPIVFPAKTFVKIHVDIGIDKHQYECYGETFIVPTNMSNIYFSLQKQNSNGVWLNVLNFYYDDIPCTEFQQGRITPKEHHMPLESGTYRINCTTVPFSNVTVNIGFLKEKPASEFQKGGGIRIKKVTHFDGANFSTILYDYTKQLSEKTVSSGRLMSIPIYRYGYTSKQRFMFRNTWVGDFIGSYSESVVPLGSSAQGGFVGYDQVTEIWDTNASNGETVYYYNNQAEDVPDVGWFPGIPNRIYNNNGQLYKKEYWNNQKQILREEHYQYQQKSNIMQIVKGLKLFKIPQSIPPTFLPKFYDTVSEWWYLEKDNTIIYDYSTSPARQIITTNQYRYDNPLHKQITSLTTTNSDGTITEINYKYPSDYTVAPYTAMVQRHIINPVVASETRLTNASTSKVIDAEIQQYKEVYPGIFKPELTKQLESNVPVAVNNYASSMKEIIFYKYNSRGQHIELATRDSITTTYLWGYNYQYPIAEITGATYDQVQAVLGVNLINNLAVATNPDVTDLDTRLRNGFKNKMVLVTTYTYSPLIGMTSRTDANGLTTYYEYDEFNRLKTVRDHKRNVLQQYEYHYHQNE